MARRPRRHPRSVRPGSRMRLLLDVALAAALLGVFALIAARAPFGSDEVVSGNARVADGDSLEIGMVRIRLEGIDAPEFDQMCIRNGSSYPCGREARRVLSDLIGGAPVDCEWWRHDRYERVLARCTARGVDLNRAMVERGWAVAFGDHYDAENEAREDQRGLWAGPFDRPQVWRRMKGEGIEAEHGTIAVVGDWLRAMFGMTNEKPGT